MWTVLLWTLAIFALLLLILLLTPMFMRLHFSCLADKMLLKFKFKWIHSLILSFEYDLESDALKGWVLGKKIEEKDAELTDSQSSSDDQKYTAVQESVSPSNSKKADTPQQGREVYDPGIEESNEVKTSTKFRDEAKSEHRADTQKKSKPKRSLIDRVRNSRAYILWRDRVWRRKILRWLDLIFKSMLRLVRFDLLRIKVKAGLEDPADLGRLYGWVNALRSMLVLRKRSYDIELEPVFMKSHLEFESELKFKTALWRLFMPLLIAVFGFPYWSSYRLWRKVKKVGESG